MFGRKVIYVSCINCSYINMAKRICLLDEKAIFVYTEKIILVRALKSYIPLSWCIVQRSMLHTLKRFRHFAT